jgi:hypothetical protein
MGRIGLGELLMMVGGCGSSAKMLFQGWGSFLFLFTGMRVSDYRVLGLRAAG